MLFFRPVILLLSHLVLIGSLQSSANAAEETGAGEKNAVDLAELQSCKASPSASCLARLAVAGMPPIRWNSMLAVHLADADMPISDGAQQNGMVAQHLFFQSLARRIVKSLKDANQNKVPPDQVNAALEAIERELPSPFKIDWRDITRASLYEGAAARMLDGVVRQIFPSVENGYPLRAAHGRRMAKLYGEALDVFVQRWKDAAKSNGELEQLAKAMIDAGRIEDARWAVRKMRTPTANTTYCPAARLWWRLGDLDNAETVVKGTGCIEQQAELAEHYARSGDSVSAKRVALEAMEQFDEYLRSLSHILDGPELDDTAQPLINAVVLSGDRKRALDVIETLLQYSRGEGRHKISPQQISAPLYDAGEHERGKATIEEAAAAHGHTSWDRDFRIWFEICEASQGKNITELKNFSGQSLDIFQAHQIYAWAQKAEMRNVTPEYIEKTFAFPNAYRLYYYDLGREVIAGNDEAATKILTFLANEELQHCDIHNRVQHLYLLRIAVAMGNEELAASIARTILAEAFSDASSTVRPPEMVSAKEYVDFWTSPSGIRIEYLSEAAAVFAQLQ